VPVAILAVAAALLAAEPAPAPSPLQGLAFLEGTWVVEPDAQGATGGFRFATELGGGVMVRRNRLELPARGERRASVHEDLLVAWAEGGELRADYWDNEGHAIHYVVRTSPGRAELTSRGPGPRFRLTYRELEPGRVEVSFEMAPPDRPDAFAPYLTGRARRTAP
jgi:hypothetical protein